ncbi:MAG: DUF4294 domain-containing protein [Bacteroidota bacterium]|nr:DUF4294 domain-containing protein [Bacteroidota bacterium]
MKASITYFHCLIFLFTFVSANSVFGAINQDTSKRNSKVAPIKIINGDTLPYFIYTPSKPEHYKVDSELQSEQLKWAKYRRNVALALHYTKVTADTLRHLDERLNSFDKKRDRKKYLKEEEKKLREVFEKQFKELSLNQAIILHKLIARQTGLTTYQHIKKFKNGITAFGWKEFAAIYGVKIDDKYSADENADLELALKELGY